MKISACVLFDGNSQSENMATPGVAKNTCSLLETC